LWRVPEDEGRDEVLLEAENEMSSGLLMEVRDSTSNQREGGTRQLGQIEGEGHSALEPWFDCVTVSGNNVHWIDASESGDMQVCELGDGLPLFPLVRAEQRYAGEQAS
jgi:hypothetical protein